MLDKKKLIKYFEDIMVENEKRIDDGIDGDDECKHENETLEFVILTLENKKFNKGS